MDPIGLIPLYEGNRIRGIGEWSSVFCATGTIARPYGTLCAPTCMGGCSRCKRSMGGGPQPSCGRAVTKCMKTFANPLIADKYQSEGKSTAVGHQRAVGRPRPTAGAARHHPDAGERVCGPAVCDTFLAHQRIASSIQDGALFAVYDAGIWNGRAFSVMQRFSGVPAGDLYDPTARPTCLLPWPWRGR